MRFMMLMMPKRYERAQPDAMPAAKAVAATMNITKPYKRRSAIGARWTARVTFSPSC